MKASLIGFLLPAAASARFIEASEANRFLPTVDALLEEVEAPERYLIELSPGKTAWVTEDEKWQLRRVRLPLPTYRFQCICSH